MIRFAAAMLILMLVPGAADAQGQGGELKLVREAWQVAFPNSAPRGEWTHARGDTILRVPLLWEAGAIVVETMTIRADQDVRLLEAGDVLQAVIVEDGSKRQMTGYCTQRIAAERRLDRGNMLGVLLGNGPLQRKLMRAATDQQFCLLDADDDGTAEMSVELNAGTPLARTPVAIPPVALDRQKLIPISRGDRLEISIEKVNGRAVSLLLDVIQQGYRRVFHKFNDSNRLTHLSLKQGLPLSAQIVGARFELVEADVAGQRARIRWPEGVDASFIVAIPDALRIIPRFY